MTTLQKIRAFFEPELRRTFDPMSQSAYHAAMAFAEDEGRGRALMEELGCHDLERILAEARTLCRRAMDARDDVIVEIADAMQGAALSIEGQTIRAIDAERRQRSAESVAAGKKQLCLICLKRLQPIGLARSNGRCHDDWDSRELHKKCWLRWQRTGIKYE